MIELMVSLVLVSILVAMIFTLFVQMSVAFRTQSQVSDLQQGLVAAETVLARDARSAGLFVPNGFKVASDVNFHQAVEVINASDGPDELHLYAADPSKQARVTAMDLDNSTITVDDVDTFAIGDLVVLTDAVDPDPNITPTPPQAYDACVLRVAGVGGTTIDFETAAPWGAAGQDHCDHVAAEYTASSTKDAMLYLFSARGYRIDADRKDLSVLQRSETAGVEDDWEDLGLGFTDLQIATRWNEPGDLTDTNDDDLDPETDWYSGDDQDALTAPTLAEPALTPIQMTVSVVVRTTRPMQGVVSARTPTLTDTANLDNNDVGDRDSVLLEGVADADRAEEHRGNHVYRWTTFRLDLRNLGVGR
jgi:hypothetical protein